MVILLHIGTVYVYIVTVVVGQINKETIKTTL